MRHTLSALVENKFGVLARVAGMFSGRGFNIDSLNVAPTHDPSVSRITAIVKGDDETLDQITKQLRKLINVAKDNVIVEITGDEGKLGAFLDLVAQFGILDLARTGKLALSR